MDAPSVYLSVKVTCVSKISQIWNITLWNIFLILHVEVTLKMLLTERKQHPFLNELFRRSLHLKTRPLKSLLFICFTVLTWTHHTWTPSHQPRLLDKTSPHGFLCSLCFNVPQTLSWNTPCNTAVDEYWKQWVGATLNEYKQTQAGGCDLTAYAAHLQEWMNSECLSNPKFNIDTSSMIPLTCRLGLTLKDSKWQSFPLCVRTIN